MNYRELFNKAHEAGMKAGQEAMPTPMVVGRAKSLFGNEFADDAELHVVNDGVCGFATVRHFPANSKFSNWMKKNGLARTSSYHGGIAYNVNEFGQSMERKRAYAVAFANVLTEAGVPRVYAESRMD